MEKEGKIGVYTRYEWLCVLQFNKHSDCGNKVKSQILGQTLYNTQLCVYYIFLHPNILVQGHCLEPLQGGLCASTHLLPYHADWGESGNRPITQATSMENTEILSNR